jgi:molybdopterin molybdotransferase
MIDFETALKTIISSVPQMRAETIAVKESLGRYCAETVRSKTNLPDFDNSAMDGFAVNSARLLGARESSPVLLRITGEIRAGDSPNKTVVRRLTALKIFTGAPVPRGADSVVKIEEVKVIKSGAAQFVKISRPIKKHENVRFSGENVKEGQKIVRRGSKIRPQEIGLLLQAGVTRVAVAKRPRVAVLTTGDELVQPGKKPGPGKIVNVNSFTIAGEAALAGGIPIDMGIARDNLLDMRKKVGRALEAADVLVVSAGISVGEYDYVKKVFAEYKVREKFWKVRQRPGEPLYFGKSGRVSVFGLPGNTVSSMVCFREYIRPALLKMQGAAEFLPIEIGAYLEEPVSVKPGRRYFLRGVARLEGGKFFVKTTGEQGSGILKSMVDSNCLIIIPENVRALGPGQTVSIQLFMDS